VFNYRVDGDLEIRIYEERHADQLFEMTNADRAHAREWLPWLDSNTTIEHTRTYIQRNLKRFAEGNGMSCGIWERGRLVGGIAFHLFDWNNRKTEIGYWLRKDAEGRGIMTRCCRAMVNYAFAELKLHRVVIMCATGNRRSRAIPERLGFTQEGTARDAEWLYDRFVDLVTYSMLEREWKR
jgi:ribosomal-protein-serine acetyltransferase